MWRPAAQCLTARPRAPPCAQAIAEIGGAAAQPGADTKAGAKKKTAKQARAQAFGGPCPVKGLRSAACTYGLDARSLAVQLPLPTTPAPPSQAADEDIQKLVVMAHKRGWYPLIVFAFGKRECEELAAGISNLDLTTGG